MARVATLPRHDGPRLRAEILAAVKATVSWNAGDSHCLCHGGLGNLEFLTAAARVLADRDVERARQQLQRGVLAGLTTGGTRCGIPIGAEIPGLLTGLAGIGHALLRLAAPGRVPSVLPLAGP